MPRLICQNRSNGKYGKLNELEVSLFLACGDFCHLLINFANNLGPDQDRQNVGSDLYLNRLTL